MASNPTLPATGSAPTPHLARGLDGKVDCLILGVFAPRSGDKNTSGKPVVPDPGITGLDAARLTEAFGSVGATGARGELHVIPAPGTISARALVGVGLGPEDRLDDESLRRAAGAAVRGLTGFQTAATTLGRFGLAPAVEGAVLGGYSYRGRRHEPGERAASLHAPDEPDALVAKLTDITFLSPRGEGKQDAKKAKEEFVAAQIVTEAVVFARDLVNTPPLDLYPESYAAIIAQAAKKEKLAVEVLDDKQLEKDGYGGIVAVGQGSFRRPRLVRLSYRPKKAKKSVALVGKGITFDTGGISLKKAPGMDAMTSDMAGSAAVVAATIAAARLGLEVAVTTTVPLAENMPGGRAQRPGDVIRHYGGITSEILNTDAEGRLVLGDAIARACEDKPDYLIETATLTGAQLVALGARTMGVMGTADFRDRVAQTGRSVGENAWPMPLPEEVLADVYGSAIADVRNTGTSRNGGMLAAGAYLKAFVSKGIEWAHLDVAGPAYNEARVYGYTPKRATGVPVRTILAQLADIAAHG